MGYSKLVGDAGVIGARLAELLPVEVRQVVVALTQAELAERAGLTTAAVARVERDEAEPRPSTLRKLAKALNVQGHAT